MIIAIKNTMSLMAELEQLNEQFLENILEYTPPQYFKNAK
jgi:hypothetical protein